MTDPIAIIERPRTRKLDLGCGYRPTPGYVRIDANPACPDLDWVGSAAGPLPFYDDAFDELRAIDVLEHLPYRQTADVLTEWARVLAPGGRLFVQVPDCGEIMRRYAENPIIWQRPRTGPGLEALPPIVSTAWRILGGQNDGTYALDGDDPTLNLHMAMFDEPALRWYLRGAGLQIESCVTNDHPNLLAWAVKP